MKRIGIILTVLAMAVGSLAAKTTVLAVNELEYRGVARSAMIDASTALASAIDGIRPGWRVISPAVLLRDIRGAGLSQQGSYRQRSLAIGRHLSATYMIIGAIGKDSNGYAFNIHVVEVISENLIIAVDNHFSSLDELQSTIPSIAAQIVAEVERRSTQAARQDRAKKRERRDLEYFTGIAFGQESVTRTSAVPGGSHLYVSLSGVLNDTLTIETRYSAGMFPNAISSNIVSATLSIHLPYTKDAGLLIGTGYSAVIDDLSSWTHMLKFAVTPIYSGETDDFVFGLLPVSLSYDFANNEYLFTFQLLSLTILF